MLTSKIEVHKKWLHSELERIASEIANAKEKNELKKELYLKGEYSALMTCLEKLCDIPENLFSINQ